MALTEEKAPEVTDVIDIDLSPIRKKRFRIDGDNNRILYLDTSDVNIVSRMREILPKLSKLANEAAEKLSVNVEDTEESLAQTADTLKEIDAKMRVLIDELFDSNVSEVCAQGVNLFSPHDGKFTYEHIIDVIGNLYTDNIAREMDKLNSRISKYTAQYKNKK